MKRILALMPVFLLTLSLSAQQAKPSPSTSQGAIPELKETPKSQSANSQSPGTTVLSSTLPVGTPVHMKLETPLYSASTKAGDNFSGRVLEDVKLADKVIIPVGASLQGHVVQVTDPRRIKGKATLVLKPESLTLPNGQRYLVTASVVDTNKVNGTDVDDEGRIKGPGHTGRDTLEIGAGTGAGAVIGGLAGGGKGLLIGAVIGAGGTVAHWLTKKNSAYLPAGSEIIFELGRPMTVTTSTPEEGS